MLAADILKEKKTHVCLIRSDQAEHVQQTNINLSSDFHGSDAAGIWKVFGALPAGVVLFHHWTNPALWKGPERPRQESTQ